MHVLRTDGEMHVLRSDGEMHVLRGEKHAEGVGLAGPGDLMSAQVGVCDQSSMLPGSEMGL